MQGIIYLAMESKQKEILEISSKDETSLQLSKNQR